MSKLKSVFVGAIWLGISLGFSAPAAGQFEVAPDHFADNAADQPSRRSSQNEEELNSRLAALRSELDGCQRQIDHRRAQLEAARRLADGAGGEGEFAPLFIEEYLQQAREFEQLKLKLAPRMQVARNSIAQLETELAGNTHPASAGTETKKRSPVVIATRKKHRQQFTAVARR